MIDKRKLNKLALVAILLLIIGVVLSDPIKLGICSTYDYDCDSLFGENFGIPLVLFSFISLFFLVAGQWFNFEVIKKWLRFAKYYLPIAVILIFLFPAIDSTIGGFDKEFMTWLLAGIFFVVSLGIIIFKRRSLGRPVSK